jgi:hypothetical protein
MGAGSSTSSAEIRTAFPSSATQHNAGKRLQTPANELKKERTRADKNLQNRRALVIGWLTSSVERSEDFVEVLDHLTSSRRTSYCSKPPATPTEPL